MRRAMRRARRKVLAVAALGSVALLTIAGCTSSGNSSASGQLDRAVDPAEASSSNCGSGPEPTIEMVGYAQSDPFWTLVYNGAETAAKNLCAKLTIATGTDVTQFLQQWTEALKVAIAKKPNILLSFNAFPTAWAPLTQQAIKEGIDVVTYNGIGPGEPGTQGVVGYVGEDSVAAGLAAGKEEIAAGGKNGVCITPNGGTTQVVARCAGYTQAFKAIGGKTYTLNLAPADQNNAQVVAQATLGILRAHPDINAIMAMWGTGGPETVMGAKQAGRKVIVGNFDVTPAGINDIKNGSLLMTIDQQGYLQGYDSVQMGVQYYKYGLKPVNAIITGPSSINASNVQTSSTQKKITPRLEDRSRVVAAAKDLQASGAASKLPPRQPRCTTGSPLRCAVK